MAVSKKYFTLEEANSLVPFLRERMESVRAIKAEIDLVVQSAVQAGHELDKIFSGEHQETLEYRQLLEGYSDEINDLLHDVQSMGCLVKDLDLGLVDFIAMHRGQEIFLCWKLDEDEITHWHGINEGYPARKSLYEGGILGQVAKIH